MVVVVVIVSGGRVFEGNLSVYYSWFFIKTFFFISNEVSETILNKYLSLLWKSRAILSQLEQSLVTLEGYLENHRYLIIAIAIGNIQELDGDWELFAGACVPDEVGNLPRLKLLDLVPMHLKTSVERICALQFMIAPVAICIVNYVA